MLPFGGSTVCLERLLNLFQWQRGSLRQYCYLYSGGSTILWIVHHFFRGLYICRYSKRIYIYGGGHQIFIYTGENTHSHWKINWIQSGINMNDEIIHQDNHKCFPSSKSFYIRRSFSMAHLSSLQVAKTIQVQRQQSNRIYELYNLLSFMVYR